MRGCWNAPDSRGHPRVLENEIAPHREDELAEAFLMWYGDTLWPTLVALAAVASVSGMLWWERRRPVALVIALLCIPLGIAAVVVERRIVTPREEVTRRLEQLVADFERRDRTAVVDCVSTRTPHLQHLAERALDKVAITNVRLTDVNVEISGEDVLRARTHFRVTADVVVSQLYRMPRQPSRWQATWEQEADGRWRMMDLEQLDPLTGEPSNEVRQYVN
jgi:hypothetical protein